MPKFTDPSQVQLPRVSKGKRPSFFENPEIDQMMTFVLELMTEVMVLRERQDTVERLLNEKSVISRADIESYIPEGAVEGERAAARNAFIQRVLRIHTSETFHGAGPAAP